MIPHILDHDTPVRDVFPDASQRSDPAMGAHNHPWGEPYAVRQYRVLPDECPPLLDGMPFLIDPHVGLPAHRTEMRPSMHPPTQDRMRQEGGRPDGGILHDDGILNL